MAIIRADGTEQVIFYDPSGKKMAKLDYTQSQPRVVENVYFAGQLWMQGMDSTQVGVNLLSVDRLGSVRGATFNPNSLNPTPNSTYLPFGEELTHSVSDRDKFATYTRDSATGLDYANQRYYASAYGRFMTADPYRGAIQLNEPQTWNRYSYGVSDPINHADPTGLCSIAGVIYVDGQPPCPNSTGVTVSGDNTDIDRDFLIPQRSESNPSYGLRTVDFALASAAAFAKAAQHNLVTDCEALADFADSVARVTSSADQFIASFQALIPPAAYELSVGVFGNSNAVFIGGSTGYSTMFQDGFGTTAGPNDSDQGHHFAAFLQVATTRVQYSVPWWQSLGSITTLARATKATSIWAQ